MRVSRNKVPFKPQEFEKNYSPSEKDISHMESLAKQNKLDELNDFINNKMVGAELDSNAPGIPTRDFLTEALSKSIRKRQPELANLSAEQKLNYFKDQVYPGVDEFRKKMGLSSLKLKAIPWVGSEYNYETGELNYDDRYKNDPMQEGTMLHELAHSADHAFQDQAQRESLIDHYRNIAVFDGERPEHPKNNNHQEFKNSQLGREIINDYIKKLPKLKKLDSGQSRTTNSEIDGWMNKGYSKIKRMPNFEDYDWKSGDFNSDVIQNPVDKYKQIGTDHHSGRAFSLDNFINFAKGGLKDVVQNENRFKKLRSKLT
jgi:hypothetical protein